MNGAHRPAALLEQDRLGRQRVESWRSKPALRANSCALGDAVLVHPVQSKHCCDPDSLAEAQERALVVALAHLNHRQKRERLRRTLASILQDFLRHDNDAPGWFQWLGRPFRDSAG